MSESEVEALNKMNDEQVKELAITIATAIAKALNGGKVAKNESTPSALAKAEQDQFEAGREAARKFNRKNRGGGS